MLGQHKAGTVSKYHVRWVAFHHFRAIIFPEHRGGWISPHGGDTEADGGQKQRALPSKCNHGTLCIVVTTGFISQPHHL